MLVHVRLATPQCLTENLDSLPAFYCLVEIMTISKFMSRYLTARLLHGEMRKAVNTVKSLTLSNQAIFMRY